jgi:hypothetical protein
MPRRKPRFGIETQAKGSGQCVDRFGSGLSHRLSNFVRSESGSPSTDDARQELDGAGGRRAPTGDGEVERRARRTPDLMTDH